MIVPDERVRVEEVRAMTRKIAVLLAVMGVMVLRGRGGAEEIIGRGDSDRLLGGFGKDFINARESGRAEDDFVDCGPGRDTVLTDNTLCNCEVIRRG
jgi:hypothetical protein